MQRLTVGHLIVVCLEKYVLLEGLCLQISAQINQDFNKGSSPLQLHIFS